MFYLIKTLNAHNFCKKYILRLIFFTLTTIQITPVYAPKDSLYYANPSYLTGLISPPDVTLGDSGKLYAADSNGIYSIDTSNPSLSSPIISTSGLSAITYYNGNIYASNGSSVIPYTFSSGSWSAGTPITGFGSPRGITFDSFGNMYVADSENNIIYKVASGCTTLTALAGPGSGTYLDATGTAAEFNGPQGVTCDNLGNLFVDDSSNYLIRKINIGSGAVSTVAGNSTNLNAGFLDGEGVASLFDNPVRSTIDSYGNLFVIDSIGIRKITPSGFVSTIAESCIAGHLGSIQGITMNKSTGTFYIADTGSGNIVQMLPNYFAPGVIDTVLTSSDYGTEPITFAGGVMQLSANVILSNPISLSAPTLVNTNGYTLTLSGTCTGTANLIALGSGSVSFPHGSSYVTSASNSQIQAISSGSVNFLSSYLATILEGGTLNIPPSFASATNPIYFASGSPNMKFVDDSILYNPINLLTNGTIDANGHTPSLYGLIGGTGGLTFQSTAGAGSITINTPTTYTDATTISPDITLAANAANAFSNSRDVSINGTFDISSNDQTLNDVTGSGTIINGGGGGNLTLKAVNGSIFSGTIDSSIGSVTVTGSSVLTLAGDNSAYSNGFNIANGILKISNSSNLGSGQLIFSNGILQASANLAITQAITLSGNAIIDTGGYAVDLSETSIYSYGDYDITVIGGGSVTFPSDYTGSVTFAQGTSINGATSSTQGSGGILTFTRDSIIGHTIIQNGTQSISNAPNTNNIYFYTTGSGTPVLQAGTTNPTIPNNIVLVTPGKIDTNGYFVTSSGVISGNSSLQISSSNGIGTLSLLGYNSYTGGTTVTSSILLLFDSSNIGSGPLALNGSTLQTANALTLTQALVVNANSAIDTQGYIVSSLGHISGNSNLTITDSSDSGTGLLKLLGTNSSTGSTTINSGTLNISAASKIGSGGITLASGTLQAAGALNLNHDISLTADSTIDTQGYEIILSGAVNLDSYNLNIINGGAITIGNINATGSMAHQLKLSGGCICTFSGTYTDTGSSSDVVEVTGNGTTLIVSANNQTPPIFKLGTGTILKTSSNMLASIVCS